jgi:hypothetical protein
MVERFERDGGVGRAAAFDPRPTIGLLGRRPGPRQAPVGGERIRAVARTSRSPSTQTIAALIAVGLLAAVVLIVKGYGGASFWPGLVAGSSGRCSRSC